VFTIECVDCGGWWGDFGEPEMTPVQEFTLLLCVRVEVVCGFFFGVLIDTVISRLSLSHLPLPLCFFTIIYLFLLHF